MGATRIYLNVINQQHHILRQVEVTQIEHYWVAHHRLAQDAINLQGHAHKKTEGHIKTDGRVVYQKPRMHYYERSVKQAMNSEGAADGTADTVTDPETKRTKSPLAVGHILVLKCILTKG